ncbi:uncharacterized protein LOC124127403 isoform X5 [Haliotis rufescens]|uniref:uncharacterized protein LOC124127403 isoform X5 n=1 Tax=Haliotis rufescens TaxID=6454 RepID=UPI00201F67BE|nr:uncharacterized protein LOC124127403 isoform X5 [Haliotis rufescens]
MEKTKEGRQSGSSVEEDGGSTDSAAAAARSLGMKAAKKGKLSLQRPNAADGKLRMPATSGADLDETGDFKDGHMFCMTSVLRKHSRATSSSKHGDGAALSRQRHGASSSKHTDGASRSKHTDGAGSSKHTDGAGSSKHTDGAGSSKHSDGAGSSKHSDGAGSSKHSDGAGSSKHSDGAGSSKHSDGAGSSKHSDGAGSSKHSDGAGSSKHSDGAVSNKNSGSDLLVVARKKKTVESRREKMSEMNRAEEDEGRNRTVKTVGDIDGKQQPAKSGKAGDADGTVEEVGAGVVSAGSGGVVSAGAGGVVSAGAAGPNVRSCPTCKHLMADRVFKDHIKECLQQFHIRTKDRRRRVEVMFALEDEKIKRRRNRFLVKENGGDVVTDDDYFLCQICQKDLSHMNSQRRTQHMNRCIDEAEMKEDKLEVEQQSGKSAQSIVLDCPMCGKPLKTESSRKVHLKQCARMLNVKTGMMLQAVKAQEDEHQVKMAAGITQQASREVPRKKTAAGAPGKKLTKKKAKGPMDEDTQLAMALSSSLAEEETKKEQALIGQLNLRGIANIAQKDRKEAKKTRKKKELCVTDLTAFCDASQVLQQTDMQTVTQTDMKTNQAESRAHRLTSIDDICHDMFSDSDFDLDPQGEKGACKEGGGSKSDEDEWREVYCSQRQQLHRRLSLGDVVVKDDIEEVGDFGRHRGELDTVEYVEEEVGDGPALTGHSSAGPMHGADPGDRPAHNSIDRKSTRKPSKTDPHSGEEELFSDDEEVEMDLLLDTSVSDNDVPDIDVPTMRHNRTCDRRSKHPGPGSATDPGFESHEADEKHSHGSDDFEIIQSGSSSSEEGNSDGSQGQQGTREETVSRISQYVAMSPFRSPDKTEPSRCRYVAMSPVRSPDKIEPSRCRYVAMSPVRSPDKTEPSRKAGSAKRKRAPSDQELVASPILSKKTHPHSVTPQTKQSPKRLKMLTPDRVVSNPGKGQGHSDKKIKMSTTNPGVTKVKSDEHMKMSTPLDRSGQGHSVVEQDSLYITPIPNQRQRSTFMLETPALTNLSQGLSMDGDFVATPVGRIVHSHSGQEILVHLNGSYLAENQTDADKNESGMQNDDCSRVACPVVEKENTRSVDAETTAASGTDVESGRSRNNNYSGQNPHTKSSNGNQSSKSSGVNHKTLSPGKKSVDSSDSDLEIVGDNFQLLSQSSFSPKFPGKFSFKKISSQTRKLSRKRRPSLYPHCHGDNEEGRKLEADGRNSQEEEDKNVLMSAVGMVTDCGDAAEESARMHRSPNTDQQDVDDVVDDPGDVWDGWDDMDAACHIEPLCDADTEESPQKRNRSSPTTPGKKHYTHKRRISMDMIEKKKKVSLATPGTSAEHGHTTSGQTSDDEDSLPSPGRVEAGEATLDFELPDADSFLWNDDNVPDMAPSLQVEDNKGRQLQQAANFKTPVSARPTKSAKKLVPPSPFTPMPDYDTMNTPQLKQQVGKFGVRPVGKKRMVGLLKDIYHKTHQYETDSDFDPEKSSPQKSTDRPSKSSMTKVDAGDRPSKHSVAKVGAGDRPSKHSVAKVGAGDRPSKPSVAKVGAGDRYNNVSVSESSTSEEGSTQRSVTSSQESGFSDVPEESFMVADEEISASQQKSLFVLQGNQPDLQQKLASFIRQRSDIHTKLMMYEPLELDWLKREIQDAGIKCPMQKLMDFLDEKCLTFTMKKMSKRNTNRRQPKRKKKVKLPAAAV